MELELQNILNRDTLSSRQDQHPRDIINFPELAGDADICAAGLLFVRLEITPQINAALRNCNIFKKSLLKWKKTGNREGVEQIGTIN